MSHLSPAQFNAVPLIAETLLGGLEERVTNAGAKQLSDEDLVELYSVFGIVFQRALTILESRNTLVTYVTNQKQRFLIEINGESGRCYRLFPKINFCSCLAFKHQVLQRTSQIFCKHVLAARLALILARTTYCDSRPVCYVGEIYVLAGKKMNEGTSQYYFTASMDSGKLLCSLLKAIQFQETAVFCALPEGLKLTVEEGKCVQASAYVPSDNFTEYHVRDDAEVIFKISIAVLSECLNIFGSGEESSLKMYYRSEGSPLLLVLQPQHLHNVMTDCEIATQTADSVLELRDEDAGEVAKLVLKAPAFLGLLADIERSCDVIELNLTPEHPNVSIVTYGMQDRSCIDMPKSSDMVQSFSCEQPVTLKYQLSHIRLIMKALAISTKVVLRCSSNGLLLLQLKLEKEDQRQMFSEFYIVPLLDD